MADIITGEAVIVDVPYARFGSRLAALVIDLAIQATALVTGLLLLLRADDAADPAATVAISLAISVLVIVGYPTILETVTRGRSPGKMAMGLRVVGDNGAPERFRQALLRALAAVVEIWLFEGSPALICSLLSAKGKRLGDVFAGTVVIQERIRARSGPAAMMPPALAGWAAGLELSRLPDQAAATARQYLARFYELSPAARAELGYRLAATVAASISPPPPPGTQPADYLSAVLAERRRRAHARLTVAPPAQRPSVVVPAQEHPSVGALRPSTDGAPGPAEPPGPARQAEQIAPGGFAPPN
jgi:uncharacterized RDD family membrane protein YckC